MKLTHDEANTQHQLDKMNCYFVVNCSNLTLLCVCDKTFISKKSCKPF